MAWYPLRDDGETRVERGMNIQVNGGVRKDPEAPPEVFGYLVESSKGDSIYRVTLFPATCECPDFENRNLLCKHIFAAAEAAGAAYSDLIVPEREEDPSD